MPRVSRVVILGSSTVGKSSLLSSILGHAIDVKEYEPTQKCTVWRTNACIPSLSPTGNASDACCSQEFEIVDTPGKKAFFNAARRELNEACHGLPIDAALLCFALNDTQSFEEVETVWIDLCKSLDIPSVLCGTKIDLQHDKDDDDKDKKDDKTNGDDEDEDTFIQDREAGVQITPSQGAALAEKLGCSCYVECSAVSRVGIDKAVQSVVHQAVIHASSLEAASEREQEEKERAQKELEDKRRAEQEQFQALGLPTVVVLGPQCSGKTAFINAILGGKWNGDYLPDANVTIKKMPIKSKYYDQVRFVDVPESFTETHDLIGRVAKQSPNCFYFVCVPVVEIRAFSRLARHFTEMVRAADAPGQVMLIGTKVDLVELEVGKGDECKTIPYFVGIDHATGEQVAKNVGAIGYIECSVVSMFGIKNALDELLPHVIRPRTAGQNVRGVLRSAGMLFGWFADSVLNTNRMDVQDGKDFDAEADDDSSAVGQKDEAIVGSYSAERTFQVFVVGVRGSGKTTLVRRYLKQPFVAEAPPQSIGTQRYSVRGKPYVPLHYEISLWDCQTVMPLFPDNHSKCALVFTVDITRADAVKSTLALFREIELQYGTLFCGRVLALTHNDGESVLTEEQIEKLADAIGCSRIVKTGGAETDKEPLTSHPIHVAVKQLLARHKVL